MIESLVGRTLPNDNNELLHKFLQKTFRQIEFGSIRGGFSNVFQDPHWNCFVYWEGDPDAGNQKIKVIVLQNVYII